MKKRFSIDSRSTRRRRKGAFGKKRFAQLVALLVCWALWAIFSPDAFDGAHSKKSSDSYEFFQNSSNIGAPKKMEGAVRVCTWNVRNYSVAGRRIEGKYVQAPKPEAEKNSLRQTLKRIDADVVLIQEMGDIEFLKELRADLISYEGLAYDYIAVTRYDSPSRLAILSKIKPSKILDCCDIKFKFKGDNRYSPRGVLGFAFDTGGIRWYAFSIHLKSAQGGRKSDENFFPFRMAEMKAIDTRVNAETEKSNRIIMGGDFNQEPTPELLKTLKKLKLELLEQRDWKGKSHTYFWTKKNLYFQYDFFLASEGMRNFIKKPAVIFDSGFSASDHRPVYVDLKFDASM